MASAGGLHCRGLEVGRSSATAAALQQQPRFVLDLAKPRSGAGG